MTFVLYRVFFSVKKKVNKIKQQVSALQGPVAETEGVPLHQRPELKRTSMAARKQAEALRYGFKQER